MKGGEDMIVNGQKIKIAWTGNNRKYYEEKGYSFTKYRDCFMVDAEDLPSSSTKKVYAKCDVCGEGHEIVYNKYIINVSNNNKYVCHKCANKMIHYKSLSKRRDDYIKRLVDVCNKNNYTLLSSKEEIMNNTSVIRYNCPIQGEHSMRLANLLSGKRCPKCAEDLARKRYQLSLDEVSKRVSDCGGEILNIEEYTSRTNYNLKFRCSECGNIFKSSLQRYTQHGGQVCKNCSNDESLGEKKIRYFLEDRGIKFEKEKWFSDCRDIKPLPFDFYLPDLNTIIEFDGRQHFVKNTYFKHSVEKIKFHDDIKNAYCKDRNIDLIRIPYTQINHIDEILNNLFT